MSTTSTTRYTQVAIILHWLIALAIIVNIFLAFYSEPFFETKDKADEAFGFLLMGWHKAAGITVIFLSFARLGWRMINPPAPLPAGMQGWEVALSKITHALFYLLMILVPLAGWIMVSAHPANHPLDWFGLFPLPQLPIADDKAIARQWAEVHEITAFLMIGLIVLHVAAALKHHFINRDDVLTRMAPWVKRN